jgi:hypothetical protein
MSVSPLRKICPHTLIVSILLSAILVLSLMMLDRWTGSSLGEIPSIFLLLARWTAFVRRILFPLTASRPYQILECRLQGAFHFAVADYEHVLLVSADEWNLLVGACVQLVQAIEHVR